MIEGFTKHNSSWIIANAGSGKTFQIINKIMCLLLKGVNPQKILCITFTNNAAFEMRSRLNEELLSLIMLDEDELHEKLINLSSDFLNHKNKKIFYNNARKLFGIMLENIETFRIQTVHSFCSKILRKFSIEAGINPNFEIIDEKKEKEIIEISLNQFAVDHKEMFLHFLNVFENRDFFDLTKAIIKHKHNFDIDFDKKKFVKTFSLNEDLINYENEYRSIFEGLSSECLENIILTFDNGIKTDKKNSALLKQMFKSTFKEKIDILDKVFLTKGQLKEKSRFPSKKVKIQNKEILNDIKLISNRVLELKNKIKQTRILNKTENLYKFAKKILTFYDKYLKKNNLLDYNDLIFKVLNLISEDNEDWIKFNLDENIDHIIVDEAQDISPEQWRIIIEISNNFFNDERTLLGEKTINIVGDEKQCIYSFQGTKPEVYEEMKNFYHEKFNFIGLNLQQETLSKSYRSSPLILSFVDEIFFNLNKFDGVKLKKPHLAFFEKMPGRIDSWSIVQEQKDHKETSWLDLSDKISKKRKKLNNENSLAIKMGKEIKKILNCKTLHYLDSYRNKVNRKVEPKDILILFRKRGKFFEDVVKVLKNLNIPVSESDKFFLYEELCIKDLISFLKFLNDIDDDLSLAEILKSPLLNLSEDDFYNISVNRTSSLYKSLLSRMPKHPSVGVISDLINSSKNFSPFELVQKILVEHKGREKLVNRLGTHVSEIIDEFLDQLIIYEENELPTLRGFLLSINDLNLYVKTDTNNLRNEIRLMTIHGSKGLESPIIIIPDFVSEKINFNNEMIINYDDFLFFNENENQLVETTKLIKSKIEKISLDEELRLFYVALTRAKNWLIVFGNEIKKHDNKNKSWFYLCNQAINKIDKTKYFYKKNKKKNHIILKYNWFE